MCAHSSAFPRPIPDGVDKSANRGENGENIAVCISGICRSAYSIVRHRAHQSFVEKIFLNLAGEFLVAAELNRRRVLCSVTYGASKSADVFAFDATTKRLVRIEVKATTKSHWPVGTRALDKAAWTSGCVWVLVNLPIPLDEPTNDAQIRGEHAPRFFILTAPELGALAQAGFDAYSRRYEVKHGVPYSQPGVPQVTLLQAAPHESRWDKITNLLVQGGA